MQKLRSCCGSNNKKTINKLQVDIKNYKKETLFEISQSKYNSSLGIVKQRMMTINV
jgi:hypothetical protein